MQCNVEKTFGGIVIDCVQTVRRGEWASNNMPKTNARMLPSTWHHGVGDLEADAVASVSMDLTLSRHTILEFRAAKYLGRKRFGAVFAQ